MLPLVLAEWLLSPGLPAPGWENLELLCHDMPCKKEKVTERGYDTEKIKILKIRFLKKSAAHRTTSPANNFWWLRSSLDKQCFQNIRETDEYYFMHFWKICIFRGYPSLPVFRKEVFDGLFLGRIRKYSQNCLPLRYL